MAEEEEEKPKRTYRKTHAAKKAQRQRQAKKTQSQRQAIDRRRKAKDLLDDQIAERQRTIEAMKMAPTPAKQRQLLFAKFAEYDFDPIDTMIEYAQNKNVPMKERIGTAKELAGLAYAKPKSIDVQGEVSSEVHVHVMDFKKLTQKELKPAVPLPKPVQDAIEAEILEDEDDGYDEFVGPEDRRAQQGLEDNSDIELSELSDPT